jgi:uncharacterized cupin superfamily protein
MTSSGEGWSIAGLDELGEGPGFRKIRQALGVTEFGVNALVLPPRVGGGFHWHERQDELYFVHRGRVEIEFGDGSSEVLEAGGLAHVKAAVERRIANIGDEDAVILAVGAHGGYVGRDGQARPDDERVRILDS